MTHLMKQMRLLNNNTIYMNRGSECTSSGSLGQVLQRSNAQSQILHFCNIMYETLLTVTVGVYDLHTNKEVRKLAGITMIAAGYASDMSEDLFNDLLDDIDFHFNKVQCRKIEQILPQLNKMVEEEIKGIAANVQYKKRELRVNS